MNLYKSPTPVAKVSQRGFTLLELVLVIGVLIALSGLAIDLTMQAKDQTSRQTTLERMAVIQEALERYSRDTIQCRNGNSGVASEITSLGIVYNDATTNNLSDCDELWTSISSECWHGPYLPNPATMNVDKEIYEDGWGNQFQYYTFSSDTRDTLDQAKAYLWSKGQNGVSNFNPTVSIDLSSLTNTGDDIVLRLDYTDIFDEEAQRRVDVINDAIRQWIETNGTLMPSSAAFAKWDLAYVTDIYSVLSGAATNPTLPTNNKYLFSPWNAPLTSTYSTWFQTSPASSFISLTWPVGVDQVIYIRPVN